MTTERAQRMLDSAPGYYSTSAIYMQIQQAVADELDLLQEKRADAKAQHKISTATWGLRYWEEKLRIPTLESDSYAIRRSRVLSKWRGVGNFSADLVKKLAEAYAGTEVAVAFDIPAGQITITFVGTRGIPSNMGDLQAAMENIVHAHLGTTYEFIYATFDELEGRGLTYFSMDSYTWDNIEASFS